MTYSLYDGRITLIIMKILIDNDGECNKVFLFTFLLNHHL